MAHQIRRARAHPPRRMRPLLPARRWEPKRLRLRLFAVAGRLARHAHRLVLHLAADHRFSELALTARAAITGPLPRPG